MSALLRLTRRYRFSASHRLHADHLNEAANYELYGKCNNPYGHGHDYLLEVRLRGPIDGATGRLARLDALDSLVSTCVLKDFEHRNLNRDVSEFAAVVPTSENIIGVIEERLSHNWKSAFPDDWPVLDRVLLRETRNNSFELNHEER